eukprot:6479848-Prymnesium_polylepis.3
MVQRCVMGELSEAAFVDADKRLLERAVAVGVLFERAAASVGIERVATLFPHLSGSYMKQAREWLEREEIHKVKLKVGQSPDDAPVDELEKKAGRDSRRISVGVSRRRNSVLGDSKAAPEGKPAPAPRGQSSRMALAGRRGSIAMGAGKKEESS